MPPDLRAYLALVLFVPISLAVFASSRDSVKGILYVFFGGLLFLPENAAFDFPLLPPMDKNGFSSVLGLVGVVMLQRRRLRQAKPLRGVDLFFLIVCLGNVGTAYTNFDTLVYGRDVFRPDGAQVGWLRMLPPIMPYDVVSMIVRDAVQIFVPFYLGRALIRSSDDVIKLFQVVCIYGLAYVPLMLFEMRMSPQLHNWIYGYMANSFAHSVRGEGFKATVFLNNGLPVAMFVLTGLLAAAALLKVGRRVAGLGPAAVLGILWFTHLLSRNVGANLYALVSVPIVLLSGGRLAGRLAVVLAAIVVAYPVMRSSGAFPAEGIVEFTSKFSDDRAQSINTRFVNEEALLTKAQERIWYGWGGYGRNRIYDQWGKDVSITDGEWIIRIGGRGIVGFVGSFGLLLWPILMARRRGKRLRNRTDQKLLDALTLIVALNAVDLLPNGLFTVMPLFLAGALAGLSQGLAVQTYGQPGAIAQRR